MSGLRIAMVAPRFEPDLGGVETHVGHLARGLADRGHVVTVYTQSTARTIAKHGNSALVHRDQSGGTVFLRRSAQPFERARDVPSFGLVSTLTSRVASHDLIHAHGYHALPAALAAFARTGLPFVLTPHYHGVGHTRTANALHMVYRPTAGRGLITRAHQIVAVSEVEKDRLTAHFGPEVATRVTVIPNGVRELKPSKVSPIDSDEPYVLAVGRLVEYKRFDRMIEAMAYVEAPTRLLIAGEGPDKQRLVEIVGRHRLEGRVRFLGRVSDGDLDAYLAKASAFATLSEHEAFGLTLAEALSAGVPSVASDIPAHREVAQDAEEIRFVHRNAGARVAGGAIDAATTKPRSRPTHFLSWAEVAEQTDEVYHAAMADRAYL